MTNALRLVASASALFTAAFLVVGCASSPEAPEPGETVPVTPADELEFEAAWLDDGRVIAVVTQGSSSCVPVAENVTANGQSVSITLDAGDPNQPCTADLTTRASLVGLPEGVDPTKDVDLNVTLDSATGAVDLTGNTALTGAPGESTDYSPSAGWFSDSALVLLTWGSSTCAPIIESVEVSGSAGTVNFVTEDRVCTMDMAPRATIIDFGELDDDVTDDFVLTLVGDNLDGTLSVIKGKPRLQQVQR